MKAKLTEEQKRRADILGGSYLIGNIWSYDKWYSHNATEKDVLKYQTQNALVDKAAFQVNNFPAESGKDISLALVLDFMGQNGRKYSRSLMTENDIKNFFIRTNSKETSELEGKIVEIFAKGGRIAEYISVNENLIKK